jgi:hypothetical protein
MNSAVTEPEHGKLLASIMPGCHAEGAQRVEVSRFILWHVNVQDLCIPAPSVVTSLARLID